MSEKHLFLNFLTSHSVVKVMYSLALSSLLIRQLYICKNCLLICL